MIILGRIVAPFGVKGWVKIHPFGDDPESWGKMPCWWLATETDSPDTAWTQYPLSGCEIRGKSLVASLDGITDRSAAETLNGYYIGAPREALPPPKVNEYYWADLIGLTVEDENKEVLGIVSGLLSTGAHDVLQVQDGETERLIPFVAAYITTVDMAERRIQTQWNKAW